MDLPVSVNTLGAIITACLGILGLFFPLTAARLVRLEPQGEQGISELRATYGGIFLSIGLFAAIAQERNVFRVLGIGYLGAAGARAFSIWHDQSYSGANIGALVFEVVVGLILLIPWESFIGNRP
ncbi:MAG TPA: DUF4345 family protein [Candidatus Binatia bacterium]|nr:DUF4345 family protein [Candidatus Binatia bacterium]